VVFFRRGSQLQQQIYRQINSIVLEVSACGTELFCLSRSDLAVSVWGHFGHDISAHKQLIAFVYLNDYTGRRNVTLAGVMPTPF